MTTWQNSMTLTKIGFLEKTNERRIFSSIDRGHYDRPSNHRGGAVMRGYNTGKVVIGLHYQPRQTSYMSGNNIYWQGILLGRKRSLLERIRDFLDGDVL